MLFLYSAMDLANMKQFIAIDIGTTHCKAVSVNEDGCVLETLKKTYPVICREQGQSEQDPERILATVTMLIRQILQSSKNPACVSFSSAMHGIMAVDQEGRPLTNLITWADTRSRDSADEIFGSGNADLLYQQTGTPVHPMSPLCKILWIKQRFPEIFKKTARFISIKEYIFFHFFGKYLIDYSVASATGLFDVNSLSWSALALTTAGINPENLSVPVDPVHFETKLSDKYREIFQVYGEIPFVIGANDGCLANLGSGVVFKNEAALTIGTSGAVRAMNFNKTPDPGQRLFNYILTKEIYITGGGINNGGNVLEWFAENFLGGTDNAGMVPQLAQTAVFPGRPLIFLPYLYGERAPIWDANASGAFQREPISATCPRCSAILASNSARRSITAAICLFMATSAPCL